MSASFERMLAMKKVDPDKVLGEQPWWYIQLYLLRINTAYLWRKLWGRA